jgi:hypothetical protein
VSQGILLQLLEQERVVFVVSQKWLVLSHSFLSDWIDRNQGQGSYSLFSNP